MIPDPDRWPSSSGGKGFTEVANKVHSMGLKFGIHVIRGISTQAVNANSPILDTTTVFKNDCVSGNDLNINEITYISEVLKELDRPILYSVSPGTSVTPDMAKAVSGLSNMYRITGDDWDTWADVSAHFDVARDFAAAKMIGASGLLGTSWPDLDMLPLGYLTDPVFVQLMMLMQEFAPGSRIATGRSGEIYLAFFNLNQVDMVIATHVSNLAKGLPDRSVTSCTSKEIWTDTDYIQPMNDTVAAMVDSHDSALFVLNCN
ncbi:hypothetical protein NL676_022642 [Syzygium grande]|nr:hypothetical protein NL676_022642 [Syzygium grande]